MLTRDVALLQKLKDYAADSLPRHTTLLEIFNEKALETLRHFDREYKIPFTMPEEPDSSTAAGSVPNDATNSVVEAH